MTSQQTDQYYGPPAPITELTVEQDLKMRLLHDRLKTQYHDSKDDIIRLLIALQHQNFVMGNSITNLVQKWPPPPTLIPTDPLTIKEVAKMCGILLETKD